MSIICSIVQFKATAVPPVSLTIPLGVPVVPDVYKIYKGWSAGTSTHSVGLARANTVW